MLILPEEQFVAMLDTPVTSRIVFTQFLANISGIVTCIGMFLNKLSHTCGSHMRMPCGYDSYMQESLVE